MTYLLLTRRSGPTRFINCYTGCDNLVLWVNPLYKQNVEKIASKSLFRDMKLSFVMKTSCRKDRNGIELFTNVDFEVKEFWFSVLAAFSILPKLIIIIGWSRTWLWAL